MPWCNIVVSKPVSPEDQQEIKAELGRALAETMDKPETGLAVTFVSTDGFFRGGAAVEDAAAVDLRYIGEFPLPVKQEVTRRVSGLLARVLGVDPMKIMLVMSEVKSENWGRRGGDFS